MKIDWKKSKTRAIVIIVGLWVCVGLAWTFGCGEQCKQDRQKSMILEFARKKCPAAYQTYPPTNDITTFDEILIEHGDCLYICAVYKIAIHGDGRLDYSGAKFVKTMGLANSKLSHQQMVDILGALNRSGYFSIPSSWQTTGCLPSSGTYEGPMTHTSVTINKNKHAISYASGTGGSYVPEQLTAFERDIESIVKVGELAGTVEETIAQEKRDGAQE